MCSLRAELIYVTAAFWVENADSMDIYSSPLEVHWKLRRRDKQAVERFLA